jgi:hypothetical protein
MMPDSGFSVVKTMMMCGTRQDMCMRTCLGMPISAYEWSSVLKMPS